MVSTAANKITIRVSEVSKNYGRSSSTVTALQGVTLDVQRGERLALLGRSGSGKSTLLNLIAGLDRPTAGEIRVAGCELSRLSTVEMANYRSSTVGVIFQSYNLIASRTALQNVELPMIFSGRAPRDRRRASRDALSAVGLADRMQHRPAELSGGEQQRVAIARATINQPRILLADEPTGNLDTATSAEIVELLLENISRRGTTVILVTHDEELATRFADRIERMRDGKLVN